MILLYVQYKEQCIFGIAGFKIEAKYPRLESWFDQLG